MDDIWPTYVWSRDFYGTVGFNNNQAQANQQRAFSVETYFRRNNESVTAARRAFRIPTV